MDRSSDPSRHHSVSLPGIRTLFPGIISGQRIFVQPIAHLKLHQIISWLPAEEIIIHPPLSLVRLVLSVFFFASVLSCFRNTKRPKTRLNALLHYRNNPLARYRAVTTPAQPAALRGHILGPSTGDYQCRLIHLMAIGPLPHRPLLLVTHTRPQNQ